MEKFTHVAKGPWQVHDSVTVGHATITYVVGKEREVVATETHADLALLRDAINEYLEGIES